jgi:hypothetical protein
VDHVLAEKHRSCEFAVAIYIYIYIHIYIYIQHIVQTWAPSDFHLFPTLREFLGGRRFKSDEEVKDAFQAWLNGLAA